MYYLQDAKELLRAGSDFLAHSVRDQEVSGHWFASIYTSNQGADFGALFGVFNYHGDPRRARFYFKDVSGYEPDEFFVESTLGSGCGP